VRYEGGIKLNEEKNKALMALKTSKGQIEGIIKMIEDGRYCVDISNQIIAAQALLKKANMMILKQHLHHCVKDAFDQDKGDEKIEEIIGLLSKIMDK
jgi:DNA-binding FrmR family transcriptional regulator